MLGAKETNQNESSMKIFIPDNNPEIKMFHCPGCEMTHSFDNRWSWNNSVDKPTFKPSLLAQYPHKGVDQICHSFVRDGKIQWDGVKIKDDE